MGGARMHEPDRLPRLAAQYARPALEECCDGLEVERGRAGEEAGEVGEG